MKSKQMFVVFLVGVLSSIAVTRPVSADMMATNPVPSIGATVVSPDVIVGWTPGEEAIRHDVYFGTSQAVLSVVDTSDVTGIYRGRQVATDFYFGGLQPGTTYWWRIDSVADDSTLVTGDVWNFTVVPVPGAVLLGIIGLGVAGVKLRKHG